MKITPDRIFDSTGAVSKALSAVLLFGPDQGLISETVQRCIAAIAGKPANPFMLSELTPAQLKADSSKLNDELCSLPMLGGQKIIVVRQATDAIASVFEPILVAFPQPNFLLIEAGDLPSRSKLRKAFEMNKYSGVVGCYGDDQNNLTTVIRDVMNSRRVQINANAILELSERLGNDRMVSRSEIEKLALYAGEKGEVTIDDVINIVGDHNAISLEALVFFTAGGNIKDADQSLANALSNGVSPIQVLRALQTHLQRLHMVSGELQRGTPMNTALSLLKPQVFFKVKERFQQQCRNWSLSQLAQAMNLVLRAEQKCKHTGAPMIAICQRTVLRLALVAKKQQHH